MERKTAAEYDQQLLDLYDRYAHGRIDHRQFLDGAARFAMGGLTAAALLKSLSPNYALAQQVAADDERIATEYVTYPSPQGIREDAWGPCAAHRSTRKWKGERKGLETSGKTEI